MKLKNVMAIAVIGLMLATALSGCTGGNDDTGGTGDGTGDTGTGGIGDTGTGGGSGNQTGENQTNIIFSDNFDDNKMDSNWKTADCDNVDGTTFEEKEGMMQICAGGKDISAGRS